MLSFTLPDGDVVEAFAAEISVAGLELVPAVVAVMVLAALGAALVISSVRRKDAPHE
ncbi:MAG: hypothetical protein JWR33_2258 [Naasia sp.]|jgi:hypothetical protein|uniref:hypothetical protein n=1 Tax=Naasia sp. TaxID=2546198 RepID=UPI00262AAA99|nr:hypothetical protein [Naasia sp.]MCU1571517.1 hypothetical protein [Naasia sp.]